MNRKKILPAASLILSAILVTVTCLSCGYPDVVMDGLQNAEVPIYLPRIEPTTSTQDYKVAINFGIAVSDALACIYNKDETAAPQYIGMIYGYTKKLGLPETLINKLGGITAALNQGEWHKVLRLSKDFGNQAIEELEKGGKKDDGLLAGAAWTLEGIYIMAKSVDNHFSPKSAKLLRVPQFARVMDEFLEPTSVSSQSRKEFKAIMAALPKINQIVDRPANYTYTQTDVKELLSICEPLRQTLLSD
jgi:hypothetical protein